MLLEASSKSSLRINYFGKWSIQLEWDRVKWSLSLKFKLKKMKTNVKYSIDWYKIMGSIEDINSTFYNMLTVIICCFYWRRSLRRHNADWHESWSQAVGGSSPPSPALSIVPTVGVALREQCGVETLWTVYMTEPN